MAFSCLVFGLMTSGKGGGAFSDFGGALWTFGGALLFFLDGGGCSAELSSSSVNSSDDSEGDLNLVGLNM